MFIDSMIGEHSGLRQVNSRCRLSWPWAGGLAGAWPRRRRKVEFAVLIQDVRESRLPGSARRPAGPGRGRGSAAPAARVTHGGTLKIERLPRGRNLQIDRVSPLALPRRR
nr:hypothetical protein GCM10020063_008270 [Dactylosporangium thailandense]